MIWIFWILALIAAEIAIWLMTDETINIIVGIMLIVFTVWCVLTVVFVGINS